MASEPVISKFGNEIQDLEASKWWDLETKIADFLEDEGVTVEHASNARYSYMAAMRQRRRQEWQTVAPMETPRITINK